MLWANVPSVGWLLLCVLMMAFLELGSMCEFLVSFFFFHLDIPIHGLKNEGCVSGADCVAERVDRAMPP